MRIESVTISGFRGIEAEIPLSAPLGILAGANNAGKSSVVDALRSVLQPFSENVGQRWIVPSDFTRTADAPISEIVITLNLADITEFERGRMISILSPLRGSQTGRLTLRATLGADGRVRSRYHGGDFDQNDVESIARDGVRFVYLHPLRDALSDLRPGQGNRLSSLVSAYAPDGHQDRDLLTQIIEEANNRLGEVPSVVKSGEAIQSRLAGITGDGPFAQRSELGFSEPRYERIVSNLQALLGAGHVSRLAENGLGYNNLLYISVLLAAIETDTTIALNVLLVEEPEAHLHPQLQSLLMDYLQGLSSDKTQVIATTHSPQFASTAQVERVTILSRASDSESPSAHGLSAAPLSQKDFGHLRRFLDVTKSMMLFSHGVILVEGIAEQLVVPVLADRAGSSLKNDGIAVVSVDGLAFKPFMKLFGPNGLPFKCAVITDGDPSEDDSSDDEEDTSSTAQALLEMATEQVRVFVSQKTFEWDLAYENFEDQTILINALKKVRPILGPKIETMVYATPELFADAFLAAIKKFKGPFAQELADLLEESPDVEFKVPPYVSDMLYWTANSV